MNRMYYKYRKSFFQQILEKANEMAAKSTWIQTGHSEDNNRKFRTPTICSIMNPEFDD